MYNLIIMNNSFGKHPGFLFLIVLSISFAACDYNEIYDAEYPEATVYMLGTSESVIFKVDEIVENEDSPFRYKLDLANNKIIIPLGVYRSSIKSEGDIRVKLKVNNDTISELIASGELIGEDGSIPEIIPEEKYTLSSSTEIKSGKETGHFELSVDIPFLLENVDKRYVLGIKLDESNIKINDKMNTIVVDITSAILESHPAFSFDMSDENPLSIIFNNASKYSLSYRWDFGDNSPILDKENPGTHTYPGVGIYYATLTTEGIMGNTRSYTEKIHILDNITDRYILNPGNPFKREGLTTGRVDNLADWQCTPNVLTTISGGVQVGGFQTDLGGVMDFYANLEPMVNGKIFQAFALPQGEYIMAFTPLSFTGTNECCLVILSGNSIPDLDDVAGNANVLASYRWNENIPTDEIRLDFKVSSFETITIGFVVSGELKGRVKIASVSLYK